MYQQILATLIRGVAAYLFALFLTRLIGRKLVSQMTFFDFWAGISMGSIIANLIMGPDTDPVSASTALIIMSVLVIITDLLYIRSMWFRKLVNSEPVTVINNGGKSTQRRAGHQVDGVTA